MSDLFGGFVVLYLIYFILVRYSIEIFGAIFGISNWLAIKILDGLGWLFRWLYRTIKRKFRGVPEQKEEEPKQYQQERDNQERAKRKKEESERRHEEEEAHKKRQQQRKKSSTPTTYEAAVLLLNLPVKFSRKSFNKAYRKRMMKVHPDRGGSKEAAQALNKARDIIRLRHKW